MPETPVYGITYPCSGDTIAPAVLADFATSMDAALAQGTADMAAVTGRPNAQINSGITSQAGVVLNVATVVTFTEEGYDNDGMADVAVNNDRLTVQTDGAYLVWGRFATGSTTTQTSIALIMLVNGVERGRAKTRPRTNFGEVSLTMPLNLVAGDFVQIQALWTGTGGPTSLSNRILSASFLAAPTV